MTIAQLIEQLKEYPSETLVIIFEAESETMETITGFLYDPVANTLELCADDNS